MLIAAMNDFISTNMWSQSLFFYFGFYKIKFVFESIP